MNRRSDEAGWFTFFDIAGGHGGGRFKLLDVRSSAEWRANHIVDSINVPLAELDSVRSAFLRPASFIVVGRRWMRSRHRSGHLPDVGRVTKC